MATRLRFLPSLPSLAAWLGGGVATDASRAVSVCAYGLNSQEICWSDCKGDTAQVLWWLVTALVAMGDAIVWVDLVDLVGAPFNWLQILRLYLLIWCVMSFCFF